MLIALPVLLLPLGFLAPMQTSATGHPTTPGTTSTSTSTSTTLVNGVNPFTSPAMATYLNTRKNKVTAAVYDVASGQTYLYRPNTPELTASMIKIDILAALLAQAQTEHRSLTTAERALATSMVEESDNKAAQNLFVEIGQEPAIYAFDRLLGFIQTTESWSWGDVLTTPLDQLALLKAIALPNRILNDSSRSYEQLLMQHVDTAERFGLGSGPPPSATIGLKDGYYPEKTGWQINSDGYVHLGNRFYLAAIMTSNNPNEVYGIDTVNAIAKMIWTTLKP